MQEVVKTASDAFLCNIAVGDTTGVTAKSSAQTLQVGHINIGRVAIPAAYCANGQKFMISGKADLNIPTTVTTASVNYLAIRPRMGTSGIALAATTIAPHFVLTTDTTNGGVASQVNFTTPAALVLSSGKLCLGMTGANTFGYTTAGQGVEYPRVRSTNALTAKMLSAVDTTSIRDLAEGNSFEIELIATFTIDPNAAIIGSAQVEATILPVTSF
jgi:hypothetical protein